MIWYEDKEIMIEFSDIPNTTMQTILPSMTEEEANAIKKKPFLNKSRLFVTITDKRGKEWQTYTFLIDKGYTWDGASIPKVFWIFIGSKTDPRFQIPSMIHDKMCENHNYIGGDRYLSSLVFRKLLKVSRVCGFNRWLMFHSVDNWQKFQNWKKHK